MQQCLFCGHIVTLIHVHGHYQCPVCTTNALPCCDGDNCETNFLLYVQPNEKILKKENNSNESAQNSLSIIKLLFPLLLILAGTITGCNSVFADEYLKKAENEYDRNNFIGALSLSDKAIKKNPKLKNAYILRGLCHERINSFDKAISDYTSLIKFDSKYAYAFYRIGICEYERKNYKEAINNHNIALFTKGIDTSDSDKPKINIEFNNSFSNKEVTYEVEAKEIYYERGLCFYLNGQIKEAFRDFNSCINMNYNKGESNYMTGLCWLAVKNRERACESFKAGAFWGDSLSKVQVVQECGAEPYK